MNNFILTFTGQKTITLQHNKTTITYPTLRASPLRPAILRALNESNLAVTNVKVGENNKLTETAGQRLTLVMLACDPDIDSFTSSKMADVIDEMDSDKIQRWYAACIGPLGVQKVWDFRGNIFKHMNEWEETE
jgi:uroporphyrinogen-III synthase